MPTERNSKGKAVNTTDAYDPLDKAFNVRSTQSRFRDSCCVGAVDTSKWDITLAGGGNIGYATGQYQLSVGAASGDLVKLVSKQTFTIPMKLSIDLNMSQRVAGQQLEIGLIDASTNEKASIIFDGTTATSNKVCTKSGTAAQATQIQTFPSSGSSIIYEIEPTFDDVSFHAKSSNSTNNRTNSYIRTQRLPDPNREYYIFIELKNLAAASFTMVTINGISCGDYAELTCEVTSGRGSNIASQAMPVQILGTASISGTVTASNTAGTAAHDAAVSGNPVRIAGRAMTANYTGVATGDVADFVTTVVGAQIEKPYSIPEGDWQFACTAAVTNTTDVVAKAAGAAGIRNYATGLYFKNTSATATEIVIKDGSTVIFRGHAGASMASGEFIQFVTPLKGTAATALNFACITTAANVYFNMQGYQAP